MYRILFSTFLMLVVCHTHGQTKDEQTKDEQTKDEQTKDELINEITREIDSISQKDDQYKLVKLRKILDFVKIQNQTIDTTDQLVALCNYLIEQACILEALDGRGVGLVRKELTENINDYSLSIKSQRYLRRLIELCEEAERSYASVEYVEADGSDAKTRLLTSNIGAGVGISLALGDITPLISSAVRIGQGYLKINNTKNRQLETLIQSHKARITHFLFTVNSFKNDLIVEKGVAAERIITPAAYRSFLKTLMIEDSEKKIKQLEKLYVKFPEFRALHYYLGQEYIKVNKTTKAIELFQKLVDKRNPLVHKDGFVGQALTTMAKVSLDQKDYQKSIDLATQALGENGSNAMALHYRSQSYLELNKLNDAFTDALKAAKSLPENPDLSWAVAKIASLAQEDQVYFWLKQALEKGFRDFEVIRQWPGMADNLKDWDIIHLLTPKFKAEYKPGIFKDDIILTNNGLTALEQLHYKVKVTYFDRKKWDFKKRKWESFELEGRKDLFAVGDKIELKDKFNMPKDSYCSIKVTFSSAQNPRPEEFTYHYNSRDQQKHISDWQLQVQKAWSELAEATTEDSLQDIKKIAAAANKKSHFQNPEAVSLLAHVEFKLGNKQQAIDLQQRAIALMKRQLPANLFDAKAQPLLQNLKKFQE